MSIESSPTASSPKISGGAENANSRTKAKLKPDDETAGLAGGGFLALMAALEPAAALSTELGVPGADPQPGLVPTGLLPEPPEVFTQLIPEPLALSAAELPNELAMLLAQAGAGLSGATEPVVADFPVSDVPSGSLMLASPVSAAVSPAALAVDPALAAVPLTSDPEDAKQSVSASLGQTAQSLSTLPGKSRGGNFQSGLATAVSDARGLAQAGRLDLAAREPALSGLLLSGEIGDALQRPGQRLANKFSGLAASAGVEGAWGHQALLAGGRVSASAALASTPTQSLESMVADTVSYWTTQGVHNAELTLDGFGDEAVAVKISLKGDQAHIGFRTDQPEIRQVLEGALAHLKEVLKSEGLVLSGVSVGGSGQNGAGAQEQRDRADSRQSGQTSLVTPDAGPLPGRQRINPAVGRALDLFV